MKIIGDVLTKQESEWLYYNGKLETAKGLLRMGGRGAPILEIKELVSHGSPQLSKSFSMCFDAIDERDLTVEQMRRLGLLGPVS